MLFCLTFAFFTSGQIPLWNGNLGLLGNPLLHVQFAFFGDGRTGPLDFIWWKRPLVGDPRKKEKGFFRFGQKDPQPYFPISSFLYDGVLGSLSLVAWCCLMESLSHVSLLITVGLKQKLSGLSWFFIPTCRFRNRTLVTLMFLGQTLIEDAGFRVKETKSREPTLKSPLRDEVTVSDQTEAFLGSLGSPFLPEEYQE